MHGRKHTNLIKQIGGEDWEMRSVELQRVRKSESERERYREPRILMRKRRGGGGGGEGGDDILWIEVVASRPRERILLSQ